MRRLSTRLAALLRTVVLGTLSGKILLLGALVDSAARAAARRKTCASREGLSPAPPARSRTRGSHASRPSLRREARVRALPRLGRASAIGKGGQRTIDQGQREFDAPRLDRQGSLNAHSFSSWPLTQRSRPTGLRLQVGRTLSRLSRHRDLLLRNEPCAGACARTRASLMIPSTLHHKIFF